MSTPKKAKRGNCKSNPHLDRILLNHLVSPDRHKGATFLNFDNEEDTEKARNRLQYLKRIRSRNFEDFVDICLAHKVDYPFQIQDGKIQPIDQFDIEPSSTFSIKTKPKAAPASPIVDTSPQPVLTKQTASSTPIMTEDEMGKIITTKLENGLIFCTAWVDTKLDKNILKILVADDGMSVIQKTKKPEPQPASQMLSMYPWASDRSNGIIINMDAKMKRLRKLDSKKDKWVTKTLLQLDEEVMRKFVDIDGTLSNNVFHKRDDDGRQRVSFMLKSVQSHDTEEGNFVDCNNQFHPG